MTSQINPNNIDGNYPVAGVSNNTQGMRDNFTNIKQNFQYAEDEIDDLQSKVLLKSALTGTTLDNNLGNNLVYNAQVQGISGTFVQIANTSGSITLDASVGPLQSIVMAGNISLGFIANTWPTAGAAGKIRLQVTGTSGQTITLPSAVSNGLTGVQGISGNVITLAATGTYQFDFSTSDGGTTITFFDLNRPLSYYTNNVTIASTTAASSATTGALTVAGGVGIVGNVYISGSTGVGLNSTGTMGYIAGAGGTVSQSGNKTGNVTLNKPSGEITMQNTNLSSATTVDFYMTNSTIGATDLLIINQVSAANAGGYTFNATCNAGNARIFVRNIMAATAGDAVVLRYAVVKGATA